MVGSCTIQCTWAFSHKGSRESGSLAKHLLRSTKQWHGRRRAGSGGTIRNCFVSKESCCSAKPQTDRHPRRRIALPEPARLPANKAPYIGNCGSPSVLLV